MSEYRLPQKLPSYLKQFVSANKDGPNQMGHDVVTVFRKGRFFIREGVSSGNWNGGTFGHELVFFVPIKLWSDMELANSGVRGDIANFITDELNSMNDLVRNENIDETIIAVNDPEDEEYKKAAELNPIPPATLPDSFKKEQANHEIANANDLWEDGRCRLFISHRDSSKWGVKKLADALALLGVDCFVAHEDIEPTRAWQAEILKALESMDVMLAYVTDDFFKSPWTNQEIGFALARETRIVSVKMENIDPQGFVSSEQALTGKGKQPDDLAKQVVDIIINSGVGLEGFKQASIEEFRLSDSFKNAERNFERLKKIKHYSEEEIDELVEAFNLNEINWNASGLGQEDQFLNFVNAKSERTFQRIAPNSDNMYSQIQKASSQMGGEFPF